MHDACHDDARASDPAERLLEDSWDARQRRLSRRELVTELVAGAAFLACAVPLAVAAFAAGSVDPVLVLALVALYAAVSRIEFPIGAGYVVPSYLVLVPMLLLLPPATVPLLTAAGLVIGALGQWAARRAGPERVLFSVPDAWHAVGPALVLMLAGSTPGGGVLTTLVYAGAFLAGCGFDLVSATLREAASQGIAPRVQLRVIALIWVVDACLAPLGLLVAGAAGADVSQMLLVLPLYGLLVLLARDRSARIAQDQRRLDLVDRERTRLQAAVHRMGDAFAARLDLDALMGIVLRGSVEALDADSGRLLLDDPQRPRCIEVGCTPDDEAALGAAAGAVQPDGEACTGERDGVFALALPFGFAADGHDVHGALTVARRDRPFRPDEQALMTRLVTQAREAATEIVAHQAVREQAVTDPLTGLGNRRRLFADLGSRLESVTAAEPLILMLLDLDGFKSYNDTFGHLAGDALLTRLGAKLSGAVAGSGTAYRLGGDEFCVLLAAGAHDVQAVVGRAAGALEERGETFSIGASYGAVLLPHEATTPDYALQLADERMYARKPARSARSGDHTRDVLIRTMQAKQPGLHEHSSEVADLAVLVGRRFGLTGEKLDELARAAELHDVGKVGIPDAILHKPGALDENEWEFMRQHTILGERILSAAPALRPVAILVRASHERWDGAGYPDGLAGEEIPLGARIVALCDAYEAMTTDRCYQPRLTHEEACRELLLEAGRQFDPVVVDAFLAVASGRTDEPLPLRAVEHDEPRPAVIEVAAHLQALLGLPSRNACAFTATVSEPEPEPEPHAATPATPVNSTPR